MFLGIWCPEPKRGLRETGLTDDDAKVLKRNRENWEGSGGAPNPKKNPQDAGWVLKGGKYGKGF